jgi:hypothetical protein
MGMVTTELQIIPEDQMHKRLGYIDLVRWAMEQDGDYDEDGFETRVNAELVSLEDFNDLWEEQENVEQTDENKMKYLSLVKEGRVFMLETEID